MPIIDFIDVIDDIIDLSSDEETVQQGQITTRNSVTLHDGLVFDEERQDVHDILDVFPEAGEGTQEATKSRNTVKAIASSSVAEKGPLYTAATQNCPPTTTQTCPPTAVPFPRPMSTTPKALTFEGNGGKLLSVKRRRPRKNYHTETPKRSPRLGEKHKGSNKSAVQLAVDRKRSCQKCRSASGNHLFVAYNVGDCWLNWDTISLQAAAFN